MVIQVRESLLLAGITQSGEGLYEIRISPEQLLVEDLEITLVSESKN